MSEIETLSLRVNGHNYESVRLQLAFVDGYPGGPTEVVVNDPILGPFTLTSDCLVELQEQEQDWKTVTVPFLISMIESHQR